MCNVHNVEFCLLLLWLRACSHSYINEFQLLIDKVTFRESDTNLLCCFRFTIQILSLMKHRRVIGYRIILPAYLYRYILCNGILCAWHVVENVLMLKVSSEKHYLAKN